MDSEELVSIKKTIEEKLENDDLVIPIEFIKDNNPEIIEHAAKVLDEVECKLDVVRCNVLSTDDETTYVLSEDKIEDVDSVIMSARNPNKSKQPLDMLEVLKTISEKVWSDVDNAECADEGDSVDPTDDVVETKEKCEDEPSSQKEKPKPKLEPKDALSNLFKNMATQKATNATKSLPMTQNKNDENSQSKLLEKDVTIQEEPDLEKDPFEFEDSYIEIKIGLDDDDLAYIKKNRAIIDDDDDDDDSFKIFIEKDVEKCVENIEKDFDKSFEKNVEKDVEESDGKNIGKDVEKDIQEDKELPEEEKTLVKEEDKDVKMETILYQDEEGYFVSTKKTNKTNKPGPSTSQTRVTRKRKSSTPDPEFTRVTRRTPKKEDKAKEDKRSTKVEIDDEQPIGKRRRTAKAEPVENTKGGKGKGNSKKSTRNQPKIVNFFKKS